MSAWQLLLEFWLRPLLRRLRKAPWDERSRTGVLGIAALSFLGILYGIFKPITVRFLQTEMIGDLLIGRLIYIFFSILFIILLLSNLVAMLGRFILDEENQSLMATPVSGASLFRFRFWQAGLGAGWVVLPFWLPMLFAMRKAYDADYFFVVWGILPLLPVALIASSLAAGFLITVLRWIPAGILKKSLLIAGGVFICALVVLLRLVQPEKLTRAEDSASVELYTQSLQIPDLLWNPATYAAQSVFSWLQQDISYTPLLLLVSSAVIFFYAVSFFGGRSFHRLWLKAREIESSSSASAGLQISKDSRWFTKGGTLVTLSSRQFLAILRNPSNRVQAMFLSVLISIFIFNIYKLPWDDNADLRNMLFTMACLFAQLIVIAVAARFFYPAPSMDAKTLWVELASPAGLNAHLASRFLPAIVLLLSLSLSVAAVAAYILQPEDKSLYFGLFAATLSPLMAAVIVAGMGIAWASSTFTQPDQAVSSAKGVLMTMAAFGAVFGQAGLAAWWRVAWYKANLVKAVAADYTAVSVIGFFWLLIVILSFILPVKLARQKLKHWDL